jgi:hypothetical protein
MLSSFSKVRGIHLKPSLSNFQFIWISLVVFVVPIKSFFQSKNCRLALSTIKKMSESKEEAKVWLPPAKIEDLYSKTSGNQFASINSPTAGARTQQDLPVGPSPLQLYSLGTPNGWKVSIFLEELGVDYDAFGEFLKSFLLFIKLF